MNVLIVYAHPEPTSFTGALKDAAVRVLRAAGHQVTVSDLYAEGFNPVGNRHDFKTTADTSRFHYQNEQNHAAKENGFADDVAREQVRLLDTDLLIVLFPIWWGGLPAILKGWFDRVFAYGVAYADGKRFDQGLFRGRRGLMGLVTGGTTERYSADGVYGEMDVVLHSVKRSILEYIGLEVLPPFVAYAAPRVDAEERARYLAAWEQRVLDAVNDPAWQEKVRALGPVARVVDSGAGWTQKR
jgi:NAD(P)H dehydrogenase (quinone)